MDQKILKQLEQLIKNTLVNVATKDDLKSMKEEIIEEIRDVEVSVTVSADKSKAEKVDLERLERRVDKIEQKLTH